MASVQSSVAVGFRIPVDFSKGRLWMVIVFNPVAGRRRAHLLWRVLDVLVANSLKPAARATPKR